jgi:hypothetical protein
MGFHLEPQCARIRFRQPDQIVDQITERIDFVNDLIGRICGRLYLVARALGFQADDK